MNAILESKIAACKVAKAEKAFRHSVGICGSEEAALRSYDCKNRREAIKMLAVVQDWRVVKLNGVVEVI